MLLSDSQPKNFEGENMALKDRLEDGLPLDLSELCEWLRVSKNTAKAYLQSGRIKAVKIGGWRISQEAVKEFLATGENQPGQRCYQPEEKEQTPEVKRRPGRPRKKADPVPMAEVKRHLPDVQAEFTPKSQPEAQA